MSKTFFRPSALGNTNRFMANMLLGEVTTPTAYMKRGTYAERIAMLGTRKVESELVFVPDTLPENPNHAKPGTRYAKWADWERDNGIDRNAENAISRTTFEQCCGAARAIRRAVATLEPGWKWQAHGHMPLDVIVPDGYKGGIEGSCDILTDSAVVDIKVIGRTSETAGDEAVESRVDIDALINTYGYQQTAYCHIFNKPTYFILAVFPVDKACLTWDYQLIEQKPYSLEMLTNRCQSLLNSIESLAKAVASPLNLEDSIIASSEPPTL